MKYFIDGVQVGDHTFDPSGQYPVYPRAPMSLRYNLWFIDTTTHPGGLSRYQQQVDWVYYAKNEVISPAEATSRAAARRAAGTGHTDTVDANTCPDPSTSPTNSPSPTPTASPTGSPSPTPTVPANCCRRAGLGLGHGLPRRTAGPAQRPAVAGPLVDVGLRARPHRAVGRPRPLLSTPYTGSGRPGGPTSGWAAGPGSTEPGRAPPPRRREFRAMLIPQPRSFTPRPYGYTLDARTGIHAPDGPAVAALVRELLGPATGLPLPDVGSDRDGHARVPTRPGRRWAGHRGLSAAR